MHCKPTMELLYPDVNIKQEMKELLIKFKETCVIKESIKVKPTITLKSILQDVSEVEELTLVLIDARENKETKEIIIIEK